MIVDPFLEQVVKACGSCPERGTQGKGRVATVFHDEAWGICGATKIKLAGRLSSPDLLNVFWSQWFVFDHYNQVWFFEEELDIASGRARRIVPTEWLVTRSIEFPKHVTQKEIDDAATEAHDELRLAIRAAEQS